MIKALAFLVAAMTAAFCVDAKPLTVYFMRHGQTQWNLERRFQGSTAHIDLTEKGVRQAEAARDGMMRAGLSFDRLYVSPYRRAQHTAEILRTAFPLPVRTDDRIREMCFGRYEGTHYGDGRYQDDNFRLAFKDPLRYVAPPEAETYWQTIARVGRFIEDELKPLEGTCDRILVVAHSGVLRAVLVYLGAARISDFWQVPHPNCCANVVVCENGRFRVAEQGRQFAPDATSAESNKAVCRRQSSSDANLTKPNKERKDGTMVKHVILWKLKDDLADREAVKQGIKTGLEGLKGVVPGLIDITVRTTGLESSNADVMLDSSFESEAALKGYAVHPAHVKVANEKVRPFTQTRLCLDYQD